MSARSFDAVVIGGGVSGLVCACYLARAKKRVLLLEARNALGGLCENISLAEGFTAPAGAHVLYALDPRMVQELKLARQGLKFAQRDMALVGLGDRPVTILRDVPDTVRHVAAHSAADAEAWPRYRGELFALARALRPFWWEASRAPSEGALETLARFQRLSAAAWLDDWFESDALKATLAFDAGSAPFEPGSALRLIWRAAQEMSGLQGAVSWPQGGPAALVAALAGAAKRLGVEIQTGARAARIVLHEERASGVELASGETIAASFVFSSLSRRRSLCELVPGGAAGFDVLSTLPKRVPLGEAKVLLALRALADADEASRFVVADRLEAYAAAASAARAGRLPDELVFEFVTPAGLAPPGQHVLSALVRPVPAAMDSAMKTKLGAKLVSALETHKSGLSKQIAAIEVLPPDDIAARYGYNEETDMLADWTTRLMTSIPGLFLCGAEPVASVSGRAGRIAAGLALEAKR